MNNYTKKDIIKNLKNKGINHIYERSLITGKILNVLYVGDYKEGIYTIFKGDTKSLKLFYQKMLREKI